MFDRAFEIKFCKDDLEKLDSEELGENYRHLMRQLKKMGTVFVSSCFYNGGIASSVIILGSSPNLTKEGIYDAASKSGLGQYVSHGKFWAISP